MKLKRQIKLILFSMLCFVVNSQNNYYISSSIGSDSNTGSRINPWKSLKKVSSQRLKPGDTIFFESGGTFKGHLVPNGSGSKTQPIVLMAYGKGNKPIITGQVGASKGGDYREAIYINNQDNMVFDGLEIHNNRTADRKGVGSASSFAINVHNTGKSVMNNFVFKNMIFRSVYSLSYVDPVNQEAFNKFEVASIRFTSGWNKPQINNVLVENCYFTDLQRFGVHMKHSKGNNGADNRHTNFVFRYNEFKEIGGTCILPSRTRNCLIEYNIFNQPGAKTNDRMIGRGSSVWNWHSVNTMIQYNQCIGIRGILDSHGIHVDHHNVDTVVQYNYMEDCEGGFVEILGGNERATYRFNISRNDGWRQNPNWKNSNHTIWLNNRINGKPDYESYNSYIYNNTIILDRKEEPYQTAIDAKAFGTRIFNNLFFAINGSGIGTKQMILQDSLLYMKNNYFHGNISEKFVRKDQTTSLAHSLGLNLQNLDVNTLTEIHDAGVFYDGVFAHPRFPIESSTIFSTVEAIPTTDFFGQSIADDTLPNIGASNSNNGVLMLGDSKISITNPIAIKSIFLEGVEKDYDYVLVDILDRVQQKGEISKNKANIELEKSLLPGKYELVLTKNNRYFSSKVLITF